MKLAAFMVSRSRQEHDDFVSRTFSRLAMLPLLSCLLFFVPYFSFGRVQIIQTFFVASISGSITEAISGIVDEPESVVDLLANSLPTQAIFYVQILLVSTFLGQGLELLRVVAVSIASVRNFVGPNLTEKERNSTWMGLHPLADPLEFQYAEVLAEGILYFMVTFVYSSLAPITNFFLAFCYLLLGSGYRHQLIYIYPPTPDSGGRLWLGFIAIVQTCMLIAQITIFGYLGLKKAPGVCRYREIWILSFQPVGTCGFLTRMLSFLLPYSGCSFDGPAYDYNNLVQRLYSSGAYSRDGPFANRGMP